MMSSRGAAGGSSGTTHRLDESTQGTFHYTIGPYSEPVLEVDAGDRVVAYTKDAFDGKIASEKDRPSEKIQLPFANPQTGPIHVRGAEPGDALAVRIESIVPVGEQPRGTCCLIPGFGALSGAPSLAAPPPELVRKVEVDEEWIQWSPRVRLPYRPHIGTLSTSPQIDSINTLTPDNHGGNMDLPAMGVGSTTYLPVRVPGAKLFLGDAHACQGDGEVCGVALEIESETTISVDLVKSWTLDWPRLETDEVIMAVGSARPLEDACRIAYLGLIKWMVEDYGFEQWDAYMLLSQCGQLRLGNVVDPKYTVGAAIEKSIIAS